MSERVDTMQLTAVAQHGSTDDRKAVQRENDDRMEINEFQVIADRDPWTLYNLLRQPDGSFRIPDDATSPPVS